MITSSGDGVDFGIARIADISPGGSFDVEIYISTKGHNIGGYDIALEFNPNKIEVDTSRGSEGMELAMSNYQVVTNTESLSDGLYKLVGLTAVGPFFEWR